MKNINVCECIFYLYKFYNYYINIINDLFFIMSCIYWWEYVNYRDRVSQGGVDVKFISLDKVYYMGFLLFLEN